MNVAGVMITNVPHRLRYSISVHETEAYTLASPVLSSQNISDSSVPRWKWGFIRLAIGSRRTGGRPPICTKHIWPEDEGRRKQVLGAIAPCQSSHSTAPQSKSDPPHSPAEPETLAAILVPPCLTSYFDHTAISPGHNPGLSRPPSSSNGRTRLLNHRDTHTHTLLQ